jgi:hypothetical protein
VDVAHNDPPRTYLDRVVIEIGRTVRIALHGWPETMRLCILVIVITVAVSSAVILLGK